MSFITVLQKWDGCSLNDSVKDALGRLYNVYKEEEQDKSYFIGDNIAAAILELNANDKLILGNNWHAICIINKEQGWIFYDSNEENGYELCEDFEDLVDKNSASLGSLVFSLNSVSEHQK